MTTSDLSSTNPSIDRKGSSLGSLGPNTDASPYSSNQIPVGNEQPKINTDNNNNNVLPPDPKIAPPPPPPPFAPSAPSAPIANPNPNPNAGGSNLHIPMHQSQVPQQFGMGQRIGNPNSSPALQNQQFSS
jgi:hypothetical protein